MRVQKRGGALENLDIGKIHAVLEWACHGNGDIDPVKGVSISDIELNAQLHLHDKIKTSDIHGLLIKSAAELISEETPNYDIVAARLVWFAVRKEAFGANQPPHLSVVIDNNVKLGFYDANILKLYTTEEIDELNSMIDHRRDDLFRYAGAEQMRRKYLTQNRKARKPTESFQFPYIMVAATLFGSYPKSTRMSYVKDYYDAISTHDLSEPTPVMSGVRTNVRQYSSCVVVSAGDDLGSIERAGAAIMRYASRKAGLGIDGGRIRAEGAMIRGGEAVSTGQIPFIKYFNGALKSCSQGAVRGASATYNFPFFHAEFENLIELKNEKGSDETRVRTMDYNPHFNRVVFERWSEGKDLTLFSPEDVPDLWPAFYSGDIDKFRKVYERYERQPGILKRTINARAMMNKYLEQRFETTRVYAMFADTTNKQSPFYEPITSSNLCLAGSTPITIRVGGVQRGSTMEELSKLFALSPNELEILSYDIEGDLEEFKPVLAAAMTNASAEVVRIVDLDTGKFLDCTPDHKVWTVERGYVEAKDLTPDDQLNVGGIYSIGGLRVTHLPDPIAVYDVTVDGNHNLFANDILVHNCQEIQLVTRPLTAWPTGLYEVTLDGRDPIQAEGSRIAVLKDGTKVTVRDLKEGADVEMII
jgi:ribonucleotide reductase alpha subunit